MFKNLVYLRDVIGQPYVGVKFSLDEILPILEVWSSFFDKETGDFTKHLIFTNNRNKRDGESYHITLFNAMEWKTIVSTKSKEEIDTLFKNVITDIVFEGIGKAIKDGNEAHFIVVTSNQLNLMRTSLGLEIKDLHITLGFNKKDVFGVSKGLDTIFIKLPIDNE